MTRQTRLLLAGILLLGATRVSAQPTAGCLTGSPTQVFVAGGALYWCSAPNTWTPVSTGGGGVPAGAIVFVASGTCPATYTEVAALNGRLVRGTLAANADVGTTGGSDTVTPTFTGSAATTSAVSAGTPAGTVAAHTIVSTKQGTATGNVVTTATHVFTGSALGTHTHTVTAAGTIGAIDVRGAFLALIACQKN